MTTYTHILDLAKEAKPPSDGCEGPGLADTGGRLVYAAWAGA